MSVCVTLHLLGREGMGRRILSRGPNAVGGDNTVRIWLKWGTQGKKNLKKWRLSRHKLESRLLGEIPITSDTQMTPPLWQKARKN